MRVGDRKIGREGTNLGGLGSAKTIRLLSDPGCFESDDLILGGCWDSEEVIVKHWFGCFPGRNRRRVAVDAAIPTARPNQHQPGRGVSVLTVVDAPNGFHVGYYTRQPFQQGFRNPFSRVSVTLSRALHPHHRAPRCEPVASNSKISKKGP